MDKENLSDIIKAMQEQMRQHAEQDKKEGIRDKDNPIEPEMFTKYDMSDPMQAVQMSQEMMNKLVNKKTPIGKKIINILSTLLSIYNWWWSVVMILIVLIYFGKTFFGIIRGNKSLVLTEGERIQGFLRPIQKYKWFIKPVVTAISTYFYYKKFFA